MNTVLTIKEIYVEGFKNIGSQFTKKFFKTFVWFVLASYAIVLYAFIFRMVTGFAFD